MTITVGMIGPQRGWAINPLLIFMSAIRVNSGTAEVGKNAASRPTLCMPLPHETSLLALHHPVNGRCRTVWSSVSVGFRAPIELDGYPLDDGVGRFLEFSPFLCFRQPVLHFSPGMRHPLTAHVFQRSKAIF
jgi:hypothetical protein